MFKSKISMFLTILIVLFICTYAYGVTYYSGIPFSNSASDGDIATWTNSGKWEWVGGATLWTLAGNWKMAHTNGSAEAVEFAVGAVNTALMGTSATGAPAFRALLDADIPAAIDPDKIGTDGTANDKIEPANINIVSMDITTVDTIVWNAGGMIASGTCTDAAEATINSGPIVHSIICTDANTSVIDGHVVMPDGWNAGTVTFEMEYIQSAADTADFLGDIKAMCRGATETVNNTWGDTVAMDDAGVTGSNAVDHLTSGAVTANGTCAAGDTLYWKWTWSDDSDTAPATLNITGMKMEFTKTLGD